MPHLMPRFLCLHDMVHLHIMVFMFFFFSFCIYIFFPCSIPFICFHACVFDFTYLTFSCYMFMFIWFISLCLCYRLFLVIFKLVISMKGNDIVMIISTKHARKAISTFDMVCQCISRYRTCSKKTRDPCL